MLKGQITTEIELGGGVLYFVFIVMIMLALLVAPVLYTYETYLKSAGEVNAAEYANVARAKFSEKIGDVNGDIYMDKLYVLVEKGLSGIGLESNYIEMNNVVTGDVWVFRGTRGNIEHDMFVLVSSDFKPVNKKGSVILKKNNDYVVNVYLKNESVVFDIYNEPVCVDDDILVASPDVSRIPCGTLSELEIVEADKDYILDSITAPVKNSGKTNAIEYIRMTEDMTPEDLVVSGTRFASTSECFDKTKRMCFRIMGDYRFPVMMNFEVKNDAGIIELSAEAETE